MFIELIHSTGEGIIYNVNSIAKIYKYKDSRIHVYFTDGYDGFYENKYEDVKSLIGTRE